MEKVIRRQFQKEILPFLRNFMVHILQSLSLKKTKQKNPKQTLK